MKLHQWMTFACACAMAITCWADPPATQPSAERADLAPRHERWMRYPAEVRSVCFDRHRRAWFTLARGVPLDQMKREVERAEKLSVPWVDGVKIFLFDSAGRIWLSPQPQLLLGYDPKSGEWIEKLAVGFKEPGNAPGNREHNFTGAMLEDSEGRIFATDESGCHIYDHGVWTYQTLNDANVAYAPRAVPEPEHGPIGLTRDDDGRVYAWELGGREGGFPGCQVHSRDGWKQILTTAGNPPGRILAIIPLKESQILVCPNGGAAFTLPMFDTPEAETKQIRDEIALLGNDVFATREDAERRLISHGENAVAELKAALGQSPAPEVRLRGRRILKAIEQPGGKPQVDGHTLVVMRAVFHDGVGDAYLWARPGVDPADRRQLELWHLGADGHLASAPAELAENLPLGGMAVDKRGLLSAGQSLVLLKDGKQTELTDVSDGPIQHLYGIDKGGRIYLRTLAGIISIDPAAPETRPTLPITSDAIFAGNVCKTADGKMCARLTDPGHGYLSLFENGKWTELSAPPNEPDFRSFSYIQPLRGGGLIAQQRGHALLFESGQWSVFDDLRKLIEAKSDLLIKQIDNALPGVESPYVIRVDARNAIWWAQPNRLSVWDKGHWLPEADAQIVSPLRDCLPVFGGRLMLLSNRQGQAALAHIESGAITSSAYPAAASSAINWYQNVRNLDIDSTGNCYIPRRDGSVLQFDSHGFRMLPAIGLPRMEDSARRIWFVDPQRHVLTALDPGGSRAEFHDQSLSEQCAIVEDNDHTYWTYTPRGLLHLSLSPDRIIRASGPAYSRGIPSQDITGMWIDPQRNLWLATRVRLYRAQLP